MLPYLLAIAGGYLIGNSMKDETPKFDEGGMAKGGVVKKGDTITIKDKQFIVANKFKSINDQNTYFLVSKDDKFDKYGMPISLTLTEKELKSNMMDG